MTARFDRPYSTCDIHIKRDEDWNDALVLQRLMADKTIAPLDFSNIAKLELFIRPRFDHLSLIRKLSSVPTQGGEIIYSRAVPGKIQFLVGRATVIASVPTGAWQHFLVATDDLGGTAEYWRGPITVHPGNISA